jgi:hypothetical protein
LYVERQCKMVKYWDKIIEYCKLYIEGLLWWHVWI